MIRHIFKIIWNERRANAWVFMEYILIFCVLWFCVDYISSVYQTYESKPGFEVSDVYMLKMGQKPEAANDPYGLALTFLDRVKHHPDVENVTIGMGTPYGGYYSNGTMRVNADPVVNEVRFVNVSSEFFDVFRIPLTSGRAFDWKDEGDKEKVVISALKKDLFGGGAETPLIPINQIHKLTEPQKDEDRVVEVIGTTGKVLDAYRGIYTSTVFSPLQRQDVNLAGNQIAVRVKSGTSKNFPEKFLDEMKEQLTIGPYYLASVEPLQVLKERLAASGGLVRKMNSTYAITSFLMINIFLGILGTFWFRTQARRGQIGLRMALGSPAHKIKTMMIAEILFLLLLASAVGTVVCLAVFGQDLLQALGIPTIDRESWRINWTQEVINFGLTFGFLALISIAAVLYPANQAARTQPAEVLREE